MSMPASIIWFVVSLVIFVVVVIVPIVRYIKRRKYDNGETEVGEIR